MSQHPLVLAVQDTTFFNYTHHPHCEELGAIGNKKQKQQGFEQTIALSPDGVDVVTVCDREADIYEMFALAQDKEAHLLVRASTDRALVGNEARRLWPKVRVNSGYVQKCTSAREKPVLFGPGFKYFR